MPPSDSPSTAIAERRQLRATDFLRGACLVASGTTLAALSSAFVDDTDRNFFRRGSIVIQEPERDDTRARQEGFALGPPLSEASGLMELPRALTLPFMFYEAGRARMAEEIAPLRAPAAALTILQGSTSQAGGDASKASALTALLDLEAFTIDDWDMDGARAISTDVIEAAGRVLQRIPEGAALPDIAPAADGSVCMEWNAPSGSLWVDVGPNQTAWLLRKFEGKREEKRLPLDGSELASYLRAALESLYPPKAVGEFQAVFQAA